MVLVSTASLNIPKEKKTKSIIQSIARTALIPSVVAGNAITGVIERNIQKTINPSYTAGRTTTKEAASTTTGKILGSAIAATGAASVVASGAAGKALSTTKGKTAALVVGGAASISPTITKAVIETPAALVDTGAKIGGEVEKIPDIENKDIGLGGLLLAGAGGLLAGAGITKGAEIIKDFSTGNEGAAGLLGTNDTISNAGVITPQTQTLTKSTGTKRKKTRSKAQQQKISQSVRINISNKNSANRTNKYINTRMF